MTRAAARRSLRLCSPGAAAAVLLLCAPACAPPDKGKTIQVVLITKALDSEWWQRVRAGAEAAARADGAVRLAVLAPQREVNIDQQVAILEDQIVKKVAALAVAPAGVSEVIPVLEKAKAAGIPVLIFDTDVPWPSKLSFIGLDNRLGGRLAGDYIVRAIEGRGKVAVIRGVLGVATHEERVAGFLEALARAPRVQCVAIQPANSERALGMAVMENLLTSHPDLAAVFATNDQMALGAVEAVAGRGLTGKIVLVGFDATYEAVRAVQAGRLNATLAGHPELMGRLAVEQAVRAARSQPIQPRIDIHTAVVTADNAAAFLP